jgi:hypothetical protein
MGVWQFIIHKNEFIATFVPAAHRQPHRAVLLGCTDNTLLKQNGISLTPGVEIQPIRQIPGTCQPSGVASR